MSAAGTKYETVRGIAESLRTIAGALAVAALLIMGVLTLFHFPHSTDRDASRAAAKRSSSFYEAAYQPSSRPAGLDYETVAATAARVVNVEDSVREVVGRYGLEKAKVLDVGSGRGYLQDIVDDYTGLDISPSVARHYHKPFVQGSAFDLPFPDGSFDAVWSIWLLEHLDRPERALSEMRRVLKPGGVLILAPAWDCEAWYADGFAVRPYSDFNLRGKLVKASIRVRQSQAFYWGHRLPTRIVRRIQYAWGKESAPLQFTRLEPNYQQYWQPDSDAAIGLDSYEAYLWFRARGDECLNCTSGWNEILETRTPTVFRIKKDAAAARRR